MADRVGNCHLTKMCSTYDATSNLKQKEHGKVIKVPSKGVMVARIQQSGNFCPWIERFKRLDFVNEGIDQQVGEAQVAAMEMQAKLAQIEKDRNERLKKFQQDVCERVKRTRQQKWHEQLNRSIEKLEKEATVLCQTVFPKGKSAARKHKSSIQSGISVNKIKNAMTREANVDPSHNLDNVLKSVEEIDQNAKMIKHQSDQAKACLVSKIIETDPMELPGGFWGSAKIDGSMKDGMRGQQRKAVQQRDSVVDELSKGIQEEVNRQPGLILNDMWKNFDADKGTELLKSVRSSSTKRGRNEGERGRRKGNRKIQFKVPESEIKYLQKESQNENQATRLQNSGDKTSSDNLLRRDANDEKENRSQYWTCRKIFMDIEREKVRECQRRRRHKEVISRLKQEKEIERNMIEKEVDIVIPKVTEKKEDDVDKGWKEQNYMNRTIKGSKDSTRRKEMDRYVDGLKNLILQKGGKGILPSVCSCRDSLLDTNPYTCANNCIFYQNPKELARILSSVLSGLES